MPINLIEAGYSLNITENGGVRGGVKTARFVPRSEKPDIPMDITPFHRAVLTIADHQIVFYPTLLYASNQISVDSQGAFVTEDFSTPLIYGREFSCDWTTIRSGNRAISASYDIRIPTQKVCLRFVFDSLPLLYWSATMSLPDKSRQILQFKITPNGDLETGYVFQEPVRTIPNGQKPNHPSIGASMSVSWSSNLFPNAVKLF